MELLPIGHPDWPDYANCKGREEEMFVEGAAQNVAKRRCRHCPVKFHCLAYSLDFNYEKGVWGGMTERERRALLRRHPHITNWRRFFRESLQKMTRRRIRMCWACALGRCGQAPHDNTCRCCRNGHN